MAIKIKNRNKKIGSMFISERKLPIAEKKLMINTSPFFYEKARLKGDRR
jgi:hypothetical protein